MWVVARTVKETSGNGELVDNKIKITGNQPSELKAHVKADDEGEILVMLRLPASTVSGSEDEFCP